MATKVFDLSRRAAETWLGSNWAVQRELLDVLSLNREVDDVSLYLKWNRPFDALAERPVSEVGTGDCCKLEPFVARFASSFAIPLPEHLARAGRGP